MDFRVFEQQQHNGIQVPMSRECPQLRATLGLGWVVGTGSRSQHSPTPGGYWPWLYGYWNRSLLPHWHCLYNLSGTDRQQDTQPGLFFVPRLGDRG